MATDGHVHSEDIMLWEGRTDTGLQALGHIMCFIVGKLAHVQW